MARNGWRKDRNTNAVWETCTEEQLEQIIRDKLDQHCRKALSILVSIAYDEDTSLKGLLERGYCIGNHGCLTNIIGNCSDFLTGNKGVWEQGQEQQQQEQDQQPPPPPFRNLELLVEFNLQFMVYTVQKYRPNLTRISALRSILRNDLNLNGSVLIDENDTPSVFREIVSKLNFDDNEENPSDQCDHDDNVDKERFMGLEIREMFSKLDDSISEDEKNTMMGDLEGQLKARIRWATKKMLEARSGLHTAPILYLQGQTHRLQEYKTMMLTVYKADILSLKTNCDDIEKAKKGFEKRREEIKAEVSASKLIESETRRKCLELESTKFDKKNKLMKNWEKNKVKLQEELVKEKRALSKWEQNLKEIERAITLAELDLVELEKTIEVTIENFDKGRHMGWESWKNYIENISDMKIQVIANRFSILKSMVTNSIEIP